MYDGYVVSPLWPWPRSWIGPGPPSPARAVRFGGYDWCNETDLERALAKRRSVGSERINGTTAVRDNSIHGRTVDTATDGQVLVRERPDATKSTVSSHTFTRTTSPASDTNELSVGRSAPADDDSPLEAILLYARASGPSPTDWTRPCNQLKSSAWALLWTLGQMPLVGTSGLLPGRSVRSTRIRRATRRPPLRSPGRKVRCRTAGP